MGQYRRIRPRWAAVACATVFASCLIVPAFADGSMSDAVTAGEDPIIEAQVPEETLAFDDFVLPDEESELSQEDEETSPAEVDESLVLEDASQVDETEGAIDSEEEQAGSFDDGVGAGQSSSMMPEDSAEFDDLADASDNVSGPDVENVPSVEGGFVNESESDERTDKPIDAIAADGESVVKPTDSVEDVSNTLAAEETADGSEEAAAALVATHAPGWETKDGERYYYDSDGKLVTGEKLINGAWYYFDSETGAMATGFTDLSGAYLDNGPKTVYYGSDGKMIYGEKQVNGDWYYLDPLSGAMVKNNFAHLDGAYLTNGPKTCFYGADGKMFYGEKEFQQAWYYLYPDSGARAENAFVQLSGAYLDNGPKTVYYGSDGKMTYGEKQVNGDWYYLNPSSGARAENSFVQLGGAYLDNGPKTVYYDEQGRMVHGWAAAGSNVWWFNEASGNREYISDYFTQAWRKAQSFASTTPYLILSDYYGCKVTIFQGSKGQWKPLHCWVSSPGAYGTPTVMGTFTVADRGYSFGHGYTCYYWTQFYGDYLFHSIKYYEGTWTPMDGRLGYNISQGCVRLDPNNAYWIYKNIPRGTTVHSY